MRVRRHRWGSVVPVLLASAWGAAGQTIDFEPPTYGVGGLPAPWTVIGTGPIAVSSAAPYGGVQCLEASMFQEGSSAYTGEAEYPVSVPVGQSLTVTAELMPANYNPGSYDPGYVSHGRFSVWSTAGYPDITVYFEMNKPYGQPISPSHRGIYVQGADFVYTRIGDFLPGGYHHISLTWNWGSGTIDVLVRRPDATEYTHAVGLSGADLVKFRVRGAEITGIPARFDDIVFAGPPAPHDTHLRIGRGAGGGIDVDFVPASGPSYAILYAGSPGGPWETARGAITGDGETTYHWTDDGSETGAAPSSVAQRYYELTEE